MSYGIPWQVADTTATLVLVAKIRSEFAFCRTQRPEPDRISCPPREGPSPVDQQPPGSVKVDTNSILGDRYRIDRKIGEGGMATVYLADDLKHNRQVAVKVFRPELAAQLGTDRFVREIEITAGLTHPHILPVLDSGDADGLPYYVMPFVDGESLRDRLDREGQLSIAEALSITREVGEALASAHGKGVIHRDVKPGNILITEGRVYVADFGVARAISTAAGDRLTATGMAIGTPAYMSPEQASGSDRVDHRTDQFALGCVLYEMLTGEAPHAASTPRAVIAKVITAPPTQVSTLRESVPPHVEAAVHRTLAKAPADRFPGIGELLEALRTDGVAGMASNGLARAPTGESKFSFPLVVAATAILLIGVVVVGLLFQDAGSPGTLQEVRAAVRRGDLDTAFRVAVTMDPADVPDSVWTAFTAPATIVSDPPGATVSRRPYADTSAGWDTLGTTPLSIDRFPPGSSVLRLEADGHHVAYAAFSSLTSDTIVLDPIDVVAEGWRSVQGDLPDYLGGPEFAFRYVAPNLSLAPPIRLHDFLMARHEVTNAEYADFVGAGGYEDASYWEHEFVRDGRTVPWDEAMLAFTDSTGRPGPSTWRFGSYPEGQADYPVTGVSWYEAAAYARYAGRSLPTVYHWFRAATTWLSDWMIPVSNMEGDAPMPVGANAGISQFGIHDMAGNAREWAFNATGADRFILGGGWSDSRYVFTVANGAPPFDRSDLNGIRLAHYFEEADELAAARAPIPKTVRDFSAETPVSDEIFSSFIRLYEYDPAPLDAVVHSADTTELWTREYVTFDAAYGTERVGLYLYKPLDADETLQTVVYFPGSSALWLDTIDQYPTQHIELIVRSGRAFAFPVYQSTFNRDDGFVYRRQDETNSYRDHVFHWSRDLRRTVDYLETRPEIDAQRLGYMGFSWGGMLAPIMLVTEPRLKVAVLVVPGLSPLPTQPEVDPFNFVTHTTQPVLMLSGEYDMVHPLATSARPMFRLWAADSAHKHHVVVDRAHLVPQSALTREAVPWLDRFLGPVD
ncbi:MAG: protein kinase [Longimicrobiales bacterium]|nr:protein kinase [Longimicrobiales bacterium]